MYKVIVISFLLLSLAPVIAQEINPEYEVIANPMQPYMLYYKVIQEPESFYSPGDSVNLKIYLKNIGDKAIPILYIVADLSQGCLQTNQNCYNLFYEKKITTNLDYGEEKNISLSIDLPKNLRNESYVISLYIRSPRYDIFGIHSSYQPVRQYNFSVSGNGNFPKAKILPEMSSFAMATEQRGPATYKNVKVEGYIGIKNLLNEEFKGRVKIYSCPFDDQGYFPCEYLREYDISIPANGKEGFVYEITTNNKTDAYALRFVLVDSQGNINSIWKSRYIVSGEDASIIALIPNKLRYKTNEKAKFHVYITGPYFPSLVKKSENVSVKIIVHKDGREVYKAIKTESFNQDKLKELIFSFVVSENLNNYKVCAQTYNQEILDEICYSIEKEITPVQKPITEQKEENILYVVAVIVSLILISLLGYLFMKRK